ncbi:hypothetical protein DIU36_07950 [Mucilaginibacter rubeus]|nr:hypothetical protein DIU36_07950 [Mucilaginibacter rubeus]
MVYKLHNKCNVLLLAFTVIFSPAIVGYYHQQINIQTKNAAAWLRLSGNYSPASGLRPVYTTLVYGGQRPLDSCHSAGAKRRLQFFFSLFFKE